MTLSYFLGEEVNTQCRNHKAKIEKSSEIKANFFSYVSKTIHKSKLTKILSIKDLVSLLYVKSSYKSTERLNNS